VTCSRLDYAARVWDVSTAKDRKQRLTLDNGMVCILRKHQDKISKVEFAGKDTYLVTSSHDKTILFWELIKKPMAEGPNYQYVP